MQVDKLKKNILKSEYLHRDRERWMPEPAASKASQVWAAPSTGGWQEQQGACTYRVSRWEETVLHKQQPLQGAAILHSFGDIPDSLALHHLYAGLSRARMLGATTVAIAVEPESKIYNLLAGETDWYALDISIDGFQLFGANINRVAQRAAQGLDPAIHKQRMAHELGATLENWIEGVITEGEFFAAITQRRITKAQYIHALEEMHHFVRWTTRVAARAVGYSHDRELRNHYLNHLKGEINHEVIIEQDLTYLGHDIDYLMKRGVPTSPTFKFMVAQESAVSFHHDPVLLAGSPLAAEGLTSHLPASLIDNLRACIASWGYTAPGNGMRFLTSHILTDGGDDGHWQEAMQAVVQNLSDEGRFQQILVMTRTSMAALSEMYSRFVTDVDLLRFAR